MRQLVLLHGAIGSEDQLTPLKKMLEDHYEVFTLNFSGHGGKPFAGETFSIAGFADEVLLFMKEKRLEQADFLGYSMGGYVAMYLARFFPDRVGKIITLGTKFYWDAAIAEREGKMLDAGKIEIKLPDFAIVLQQRHAPNDWKEVLSRTRTMLTALGAQQALDSGDFRQILHSSLLLLGDRDKMVTLDETVTVYKQLPCARLGILPGTPHPVEQTDLSVLCFLVNSFLAS